MDEGRNYVTEGQELHLHTGVGERVCTCVGRGESEAGRRSCVRRCAGPVAHTCDGAGGCASALPEQQLTGRRKTQVDR